MLFRALGKLASSRSPIVIGLWLLLVLLVSQFAPNWKSVVQNGEFAFLPADSPSVEALELFRKTFPEHSTSSNIVVVVRRASGSGGLVSDDRKFIETSLLPLLRRIAGFEPVDDSKGWTPENDEAQSANSLVRKITWEGTKDIGPLYESVDKKASLVVLELNSEFLDAGNRDLITQIETELEALHNIAVPPTASPKQDLSANPAGSKETNGADDGSTETETADAEAVDTTDETLVAGIKPAQQPVAIPPGLDIAFSGTAIYGRDAMMASEESSKATEKWTVILVIVLLLLMYRAPFLAMIPLLTVSVSGAIALKLLSIAASFGWVSLFNGIEAYVTVLVYGAGIDYCLFLIARYREELNGGATIEEAISETLEKVGSAIAASAGTTMCGIGMMYFADFGKFQQAGIAISFGLFVCLCASLTLTPAIIRMCGPWAFWPRIPARQSTKVSWVARPDFLMQLITKPLPSMNWKRVGNLLKKRPWAMWLGSVLGMLPFSIIGYVCFGYLSYGLLSDLPADAPSVVGARSLQQHFPGGEGVPVRALLRVPDRDFTRITPKLPGLKQFTEAILERKDELGIETVRSLVDPTGGRELGEPNAEETRMEKMARQSGTRLRAIRLFSTEKDPSITRLDIIFKNDPFSRSSIDEFQAMREALPELLPESMSGATISFAGETANLTDLKQVTDSDRVRINSLVTLVVFVILWLLLKRLRECIYLIVTVLFSYFATLGGTYLFFWAWDPAGFSGLDWKVPMFLFTILIAVGEDYNIFLLTRIDEERKKHGKVEAITVALDHTGTIISSCGIIMAGTFSSLMAGSLAGMDQLGFALALGVILDTFIVRPVMVPAFLILLAEGRIPLLSDPAETPSEPQV